MPTATKPKKVNASDVFFTKGVVSDIKVNHNKSEEQLRAELFADGDERVKIADAFERQQGFRTGGAAKAPVLKYKNQILDLGNDHDRELLNQLLNEPIYKIIMMDKTWDMHGNFLMFVVYSEAQPDEASPEAAE